MSEAFKCDVCKAFYDRGYHVERQGDPGLVYGDWDRRDVCSTACLEKLAHLESRRQGRTMGRLKAQDGNDV